uniref:PIN domain-containing protein n=1 Tax=Romanomermis culicivorax TaxID=13658 RepID=A0A915HWQ4_ROMCU
MDEMAKADIDGIKILQPKFCVLAYLHVFKLLFDDSDDTDSSQYIAEIADKVIHSFEKLCQDSSSNKAFFAGPLLKIFACQMILIKKLQDKASYKTSASIALLIRLFVAFLNCFSQLLPPHIRDVGDDCSRSRQNVSETDNSVAQMTINSSDKETDVKKVFAVRAKKIDMRQFLQKRRKKQDSDEEDARTTGESDVDISDEDDVIEVEDSNEEAGNSEDSATDGERIDDHVANGTNNKTSNGVLPGMPEPDKNIFADEKIGKELNSIKISKSVEFEQKVALIEDVYLRGIPPLTQAHTGLDFESIWSCGQQSEVIVRIVSIRSSVHHMIKTNQSTLYFDQKKSLFRIKIKDDNEKKEDFSSERRPSLEKHRRETLMRNMAKLRIRDEMKSIEKVAWIPVYLILDSQTLLKSLSIVKRLLSRRKFILVVPESVLARLDRLKKDDANAREAIRYLETQLKTGNKFIRSQKSEEKAGIDFREAKFSNSLKECLDIQETKGLIDCASHFSRTVTGSRSTVACILTGSAKQSHGYGKVIEDEVDKMKVVYLKEIYTKLIEIAEVSALRSLVFFSIVGKSTMAFLAEGMLTEDVAGKILENLKITLLKRLEKNETAKTKLFGK